MTHPAGTVIGPGAAAAHSESILAGCCESNTTPGQASSGTRRDVYGLCSSRWGRRADATICRSRVVERRWKGDHNNEGKFDSPIAYVAQDVMANVTQSKVWKPINLNGLAPRISKPVYDPFNPGTWSYPTVLMAKNF